MTASDVTALSRAGQRLSREEIRALLNERILVLDGGTGTAFESYGLSVADYGDESRHGCHEVLSLTRPDVIKRLHADYFKAGADIAETNTFGATEIVLSEYGLAERTYEINKTAARLAREAVSEAPPRSWPRLVAGSIGPTNKSLYVTKEVTFERMSDAYREQARGLVDGGVDLLLVETCVDTLNSKAAVHGIKRYLREAGLDVPIMLSCTVDQTGVMLCGQSPSAFVTSMEHAGALSVGLNCSTGPDLMVDHVRSLATLSDVFVSCHPNAGLPDEHGGYADPPERFVSILARFVDEGWLNLLGGCCGTRSEHIRLLSQMVDGKRPRRVVKRRAMALSGVHDLPLEGLSRPIPVGERTNVLGSKAFKELIAADRLDDAAELGRQQVGKGAQVLDVCLQNVDRDESEDMRRFLPILARRVRVPLMIDSTDPEVVEISLCRLLGKGIVNSVNLEDGGTKLDRVASLIREYGGAVVAGCIDEDSRQGQALTADRKLAIARRLYDRLTTVHGVPARDILFDPLVFPVGSGDPGYSAAAAQTIEGLARIKREFPESQTLLGISNVSFGLPKRAREVVNAVFLHHCTLAGLDFAIVNAERLVRYPTISEDERTVAEDLLFQRGQNPLASLIQRFRNQESKALPPQSTTPDLQTAEERLTRKVVEGSKNNLAADLEEALTRHTALEIVNGPLMAGMTEVGRLFRASELIVSDVLQSAEVMKAAVTHLEGFMAKTEGNARAKVLLATVKGDVHDIGKNLVSIILSNNGYEVVDLGIKVSTEALIASYRQYRPDAIGLSGLLVKSAQQMVATVADLVRVGVDCPILVGGAALTRKYTACRIAPEYDPGLVLHAQSAMEGLEFLNRLTDRATRDAFVESVRAEQLSIRSHVLMASEKGPGCVDQVVPDLPEPSLFPSSASLATVPDLVRHEIVDVSLEEIAPHLRKDRLFARHLGLTAAFALRGGDREAKTAELDHTVREVLSESMAQGWIKPRAVWRFFRAWASGDDLSVLPADGESPPETFRFHSATFGGRPRLRAIVAPAGPGVTDHVAMLVVTTGEGVAERSEALKASGEYVKSHVLQALAIELAEGFAELLHRRIDRLWKRTDLKGAKADATSDRETVSARISFGYPGCPPIEDQVKLFRLLEPATIGVRLTETCMMEPEASVSAVVFSHPKAREIFYGKGSV